MALITTFEAWNKNLISGFGSFHTSLLETYKKADQTNSRIMQEAFPEWFKIKNFETKERYFNFEVYTSNPKTGEKGWDIKFPFILASNYKEAKENLKKYFPNFDVVILYNFECGIKEGSREEKEYLKGSKYFECTYKEYTERTW